jgi:O-antigen ligase
MPQPVYPMPQAVSSQPYLPAGAHAHRFPSAPARGAKPDVLLYVLALMTFSYVWRVHSVVPVLGKLKFALIVGVLALGLFVIDQHPARKLVRVKSPLLSVVLALFAVTIASVPGALYVGKSAEYLALEIVPNVLFTVILAAAVRSIRDIEWLMKANVLGGFIFAFLTFQYREGRGGRLGGYAYYDANDFALMLVCTLPFLIYFMRRDTRGWFRLFALVSFGLFVFLIMKTGSRGGFVGFLAVITYALLRYRAIPARVRVGAAVGACALLIVVGSQEYWATMRTLLEPQQDYNWSGNSPTGRMEVWKRGVGYMIANPVLGVGVRNFPQAEGRSEIAQRRLAVGAGWKWSVAHNAFVETGAELGVIGLGLFVALFVYSFRYLGEKRARAPADGGGDPRMAALKQTFVGALVGFVVCAVFVSAQYFSLLYFLLGLVIGLAKLDRTRPSPPIRHSVWPPGFVRAPTSVPAFGRPSAS